MGGWWLKGGGQGYSVVTGYYQMEPMLIIVTELVLAEMYVPPADLRLP